MYRVKIGIFSAIAIYAFTGIAAQADASPPFPRPSLAKSSVVVPVTLNRSDADLFAATLAGRFAQGTDNLPLAAQAWSRAFLRLPTDRDLLARAVAANLQVGDVATAVRLIKLASPALYNEDAVLALAVDAFAQSRYGEVVRTLSGRNFPPSQRIFADHLVAYALLGLSRRNQAVELTARATGISVLDKATLMSRAMILQAVGRGSEAGILYQSALDLNIAWPIGVRAYQDWLVANNRKPAAIAMLQQLVRAGGPEANGFVVSLANLNAGALRSRPNDLRTLASGGLMTIAQSLSAEGRGGTALSLFHLIAHLDPNSDDVAVALAHQLIADARGDMAIPLLTRIKINSPDYIVARTELVWLVFGDDQTQSVALARETVRALPLNLGAKRLLADVLAANREDREAEALYTSLIDQSRSSGQSDDEIWPLYFGRGGARERLGNWGGAQADLRFAKAAAPNQPNILNYLGYSLADRGENIDEAIGMLRTAARLRPQSGPILDSLGWALFRAGRYEEAVSTLETAASLSPALAEITEHLGDAYWRTGREDDARMEWARTLRLDVTPQQKASVTQKLSDGLPPDPVQAARRALVSQPDRSLQ